MYMTPIVLQNYILKNYFSGDESAVYVDSAYKSRKHDEWLEERGIDNRVMGRAYRNTPLTKAQKQKNQRNAGVRCTVERVFGVFKLYYGMGQSRYLGLARNAVRVGLMCFAYNLKHGINIQRSCNPSQYSCV
jgi:IS5 family transposase